MVLDLHGPLRSQDAPEEFPDELRVARGGVLEGGLGGDAARPRVHATGRRPEPAGEAKRGDGGDRRYQQQAHDQGRVRGRAACSGRGRDGWGRGRDGSGRGDVQGGPGHVREVRHYGARREADDDARDGERGHRAPLPTSGFMSGTGRGAARQTQERDAGGLDEAGDGKSRGERQCADRARGGKPGNRRNSATSRRAEQALEREPLAGKAVEWRQTADCGGADAECQHRDGHLPTQSAQVVQVTQTRGVYDSSGRNEEQALEDRVVDRVEDRGGQGEGREFRRTVGVEEQGGADADQDDADVLDAVEREQALDVVLHQGVKHAHDRGYGSHRQDQEAQPVGRAADDIDDDPNEPVDAGLDHDPGHHGRDVGRRHRMGSRQPDVEWHGPRLRRETHEDQDERDVAGRLRQAGSGRVPGREVELPAGRAGQNREPNQDRGGGHVGQGQIYVSGRDNRASRPQSHYQKGGKQGHRFPGQQEREGVAGAQDEQDAREEERVCGPFSRAPRARSHDGQRGGCGRCPKGQQEGAAQPVISNREWDEPKDVSPTRREGRARHQQRAAERKRHNRTRGRQPGRGKAQPREAGCDARGGQQQHGRNPKNGQQTCAEGCVWRDGHVAVLPRGGGPATGLTGELIEPASFQLSEITRLGLRGGFPSLTPLAC